MHVSSAAQVTPAQTSTIGTQRASQRNPSLHSIPEAHGSR
jgi:hypothetical protein